MIKRGFIPTKNINLSKYSKKYKKNWKPKVRDINII